MREKTRLKILGGSKQHNDPADLKKKKKINFWNGRQQLTLKFKGQLRRYRVNRTFLSFTKV